MCELNCLLLAATGGVKGWLSIAGRLHYVKERVIGACSPMWRRRGDCHLLGRYSGADLWESYVVYVLGGRTGEVSNER